MSDDVNENAVHAAEQSVLGACLMSPAVTAEVVRIVEADDFNSPRHATIFDALLRLRASEAPTDVVAVVDDLIRAGDLQRAGGAEYVHQLTSVVPSASSGPYYADLVREAAVGRAVTAVAVGIQDSIVRGEQPGVTLTRSIDQLAHIRDRSATAQPVRYLSEVLDAPASSDAYDWVIPGLLEHRDRFMLTGSEGGGKSVLIRQLAVMAAAGLQPFSGQQVRPARVLVVDAENSEKQWRRNVRELAKNAAQAGVQDPRKGLAIQFVPRIDVTKAKDLGDVHRWMDQVNPDIVVIGPMYRIAPSMKTDEDALPVLAALDTIRDRGAAMLIETHAPHADARAGTRDLRPIGSSAQLRWPEFGLGIAKPMKAGEQYALVRWRGDRDGRAWPVHLTRGLPGQRWPWEPTAGYWATPEGASTLI